MTVKKQWRHRRAEDVRPMSAADLTQKHIYDACKKAAVEALRPMMDPNKDRMIRGITETELYRLVCAVVEAYVTHHHFAEVVEEMNDDISDVGVMD